MLALLWSALCRRFHRGSHIDLAEVGGWRCRRCGAGFVDLADAGLLELTGYERETSAEWRRSLEERLLRSRPEWAPPNAIVLRWRGRSA